MFDGPPAMPEPVLNQDRPQVLRGRRDLVDALVALASRAADGEGGAITLVGEPGIGKTALLDEAAARMAAAEAQVVRLRGVEAEVEMAWSGLAGLLDGWIGAIDHLAPARASAVRSALALEALDEPVEPFAVALAARDLLVEAAEAAPVVVIVDDLQWVDAPTRMTLAYIARRLQFERVAIVSARRAGNDTATDTGPPLVLDTVDDDVADRILADAGVSSPSVRRELVAAGGGIPLVLVEAANLLDDDQKAGRTELPDPLPIGPSGQRMVDLVLQRLPQPALAALVTAAAETEGDMARILAALSDRGLGLAELETAEEHGIIALDSERLTFRHPLMRSAAYHDAPRAERRAAHRALAGTVPVGTPERAWHLARAAVGPDAEVADALDEAAATTARRGAPAVAARTWELASRLTPDAPTKVTRLRLAATALVDAGGAPAAGHLLDRADAIVAQHPGADEVVERIRRQQLRCRLPLSSGGIAEPASRLRAAAREVAASAPDLAVDLLLDALVVYIGAGAFADITDAVEEALRLRDLVDDDRARRVDVLHGGLLLARLQPGSEPLIDRYTEMIGPERPPADALFLAEVVAPVLAFLRRGEDSDTLLTDLEGQLRARGAIRPLVSVLGAQSMAHYSRSFPATIAAGLEAVSLAETLGSPELASLASGVLALCSAVVGDRDLCNRAVVLLRDVPEPERRAFGPIGVAYLAFNEGRYEDAEEAYRAIEAISPLGRGLVRWEIEWAESLARVGRRRAGFTVLADLEAALDPAVLASTGIGRPRGLLAEDDDEAFAHFADAVAVAEGQANDFAVGRAEILWGERLRRARRRGESRAHLERAVELLRGVGATLFAERATVELRAAGGVVGEDVAPHQLLTPHELQIAKLVVGGASNRDLAAKLFISPRTVEAHLTTIFRKLGLRNRRELAASALENPVLQP